MNFKRLAGRIPILVEGGWRFLQTRVVGQTAAPKGGEYPVEAKPLANKVIPIVTKQGKSVPRAFIELEVSSVVIMFAATLLALLQSAPGAQGVTQGYITAVLRSECTSVPPPPPVGQVATGPDYVIMTVADADPNNYTTAQQLVTDAIFQSLMPLYCALPRGTGVGCVTNRVQWNLATYDAGGNPRISGGPLSGPGFHYCSVTHGYITAVIQGESATLPEPPPVGLIAVGSDSVMMTIADGEPTDLAGARRFATDAVFESLMRTYCALPRGTGNGYVSGRAKWTVATFDPGGDPKESGCAASGCDLHSCVVSKGYVTALLRSECTSVPEPPPPGRIASGPDYVIMTIADADPNNFAAAQQLATDAIFQSLMPQYCALARGTGLGCVTDRVQWNVVTYDAGGNARISGCAASGCGFHYCVVTRGYITAVIQGHSATLPHPPPVGLIAVGSDSVMMTIAEGDPADLAGARQLATDAVFESLMRTYCALPRGTGNGYVSGRAKWTVATFDSGGNPKESGCAASGCREHFCGVLNRAHYRFVP